MSENIEKIISQGIKEVYAKVHPIHEASAASFDNFLSEVEFLKSCILNGQITFTTTSPGSDKENINIVNNETSTANVLEDGQTTKKGRGRPRKTNVLHEKRTDSSSTARSESPGTASLNDSEASSTSSTRSKRAAAQAVGEKMEKVKSLLSNKKLRRPTDFDAFKKPTDVKSPPTKSRKTRSKQSAGSNPDKTEAKGATSGEESATVSSNMCKVLVNRISTPEVKKLANKRKSEDIFSLPSPTERSDDDHPKKTVNEAANTTHTVDKEEPQKKRKKGKKGVDSEVSSSDNEIRSPTQISPIVNKSISAALGKAIAHSSPLTDSPSSEAFCGFDVEPVGKRPTRSKRGKQQESDGSDKTDVIAEKSIHIDQRVTRKTVNKAGTESDVEVVETETNLRTRTIVLRKGDAIVGNQNNQTYICDAKDDEASVRSRTRVINKEIVDQVSAAQETDENPRSRTRVIKKHNEPENLEVLNISDDSPDVKIKPLPRTRLSKTSSQSSEDENNTKSKLKTEKKEKVSPELNPTQKRLADDPPSRSPATVKGELVRKRVEDFEKIRKNKDQEGGSTTCTVVTRHAAKNKASSEHKGKTPTSLPRPVPVPNNFVVIQKTRDDGTEERSKEEKRTKRQAKEEVVARNKEKYLKASAEETKRKREEKNLRAAAAREAAEREKALLAAKAEKEKEEKLRQIQLEKERQKKEEMLKKKLLMQQKTKEHEERRRQEEAARLARLKEQEEEHKRALAIKEQEMERQRKAADQRLAEAEKVKQTAKLNKIAAINSAQAKSVSTPTPSASHNPDSYDITPARDERSLLKPKTEDDYGIDDAKSSDSSEDEDRPRKQIPVWAQAQKRRPVLKQQKFMPDSIRDEFFENNPQMPEIPDIFKGFHVKKRVRTSSAVWNTPPLSARK